MILEISHKTFYRYGTSVIQSQHLVHKTPRSMPHQDVRYHNLIVEPAPATRYSGVDAFGNTIVILDIEAVHKEFVLHARSEISTQETTPIDFAASTPWDALKASRTGSGSAMDLDVIQFRCASRLTVPTLEIADFASTFFKPGRPVLEATMDMVTLMYRDFKFDPTATDISTPITRVLKHRRGVCQDFSHLAIAAARAMKVPARYVSGYVLTKPPPGQAKLQGADASHAWISVWAPEHGWVDFDPTNGLLVSDEHATVAYGRDYDDVSPISGVLIGGGEHTVSVAVDVRQAEAAP